MIGLDRVSGVLLQDMARRGQQLLDHSRIGGRLIGADLAGTWAVLQGTGEDRRVAARSRYWETSTSMTCPNWSIAVQIYPLPGNLDIDLIHEPPITGGMPARSCRVDEQWGEPLHPAGDANVVDLPSAFGQQLFNIAVGQSVTEIPTHCKHDHLRRDRKPVNA